MKIRLARFAESPDGTFGRLYIPETAEQQFCYTLEEEALNNKRGISRIPAGVYTCRRSVYHRYGYETFEVTGVPNRTRILFHPGNTEEDTQGCILVGTSMGPLEVTDEETGERRDKLAVYDSRVCFRRFMEKLYGRDKFVLTIEDTEWQI